jgi:hypothetical protein
MSGCEDIGRILIFMPRRGKSTPGSPSFGNRVMPPCAHPRGGQTPRRLGVDGVTPTPLTLAAHPSEGHDWFTGETVVVLHPSNEHARLVKSSAPALAHLTWPQARRFAPAGKAPLVFNLTAYRLYLGGQFCRAAVADILTTPHAAFHQL